MAATLERLSVRSAPSGPSVSTTATGWVDVPEMAGSLATAANADLEVTFSAEAFTSGARMFVRALVDGQPADPSDVVFARATSAEAARSPSPGVTSRQGLTRW